MKIANVYSSQNGLVQRTAWLSTLLAIFTACDSANNQNQVAAAVAAETAPSHLTAAVSGNKALLSWRFSANEAATPSAFNVYRLFVPLDAAAVESDWQIVGQAEQTEYPDRLAGAGFYNYRVSALFIDGSETPQSGIVRLAFAVEILKDITAPTAATDDASPTTPTDDPDDDPEEPGPGDEDDCLSAATWFNELRSQATCLTKTRYNGAGDDGQWLSDDDRIEYWLLASYAAPPTNPRFLQLDHLDLQSQASFSEMVFFAAPGDDGVWGNEDDQASALAVSDAADGAIRYWHYRADSNGCWGDTHAQTNQIVVRQQQGQASAITRYANPGSDAIWLSADDFVGAKAFVFFDSQGLPTFTTQYSNRLTQANWQESATDLLYPATLSGTLAPLQLTSATMVTGPAADTQWLSNDDWGFDSICSSSGGLLTVCEVRESPGLTPLSRQLYSYDGQGRLTLLQELGAGLDGIFATADDVTHYTERMSYDSCTP